MSESNEALIVALNPDPSTPNIVNGIEELVDKLGDLVTFYKLGIDLLVNEKFWEILPLLTEKGKKIFLDMKSIEIEEVIRRTVRNAGLLNIKFLTLDGNNSNKNISAAVRGREESGNGVKLLALTLLTSIDAHDFSEIYGRKAKDIDDFVLSRAKRLLNAGCDGIIASGRETEMLREKLRDEVKKDFLIVTPGIRRASDSKDDQKRFVTPAEAIMAGSNYLVVGRPITESEDPELSAREILDEMDEAFDKKSKKLESLEFSRIQIQS
ncbi:MAG: orotidine-5'-phosphate decarboxylase [Candidatus Dadabacteria bacterium]|nr:orotidine-5'-phosphate decarboxylase [Candidatus Dadabacteria bacterium]